MGTTLTGTTPQDTYDSLIKVTDNGPLSGTLKALSDGLGNDSTLSLSTTAASIAGTLDVSGTTTLDVLNAGASTLASASITGAIDMASIETDAAETSSVATWKLGNKGDGSIFVAALDYVVVQVAGLVIKLPIAIFPDTKNYYDRVIADSGTFEGMACYESATTILKSN